MYTTFRIYCLVYRSKFYFFQLLNWISKASLFVSILSLSQVHPSGDYLYVGAGHPVIRLYDLTTMQCFTSSQHREHHQQIVNDLHCTSDGRVLASASGDGMVKLWDTTNQSIINSYEIPHGGNPTLKHHLLYIGRD